MMGFAGYGMMGGFGGLGMLIGLLFWVGLVALVLWGMGALTGPRAGGETPLEILRRRYARGEIDREDFERARETLA